MNHILVPVGSSENSKNTLQYAIDLASEMGAKVFVFRAYKAISKAGTLLKVDDIVSRETQLYLRSVVQMVDTKDVDVKIIAAQGDPTESITHIHDELGVDLIVLGPKSNSIREEVFLGSTSGRIVKNTKIPVLVVPEGYQFKPFKSVLTAFKSGRLNKKEVLNPLISVKKAFQSKVNLLLVKTPDFKEEDAQLDDAFLQVKDTFAITENLTIFHGVLEHFQSNNPHLLCVFRRRRGFFQKLWESYTILKKEFYCSIPMLILSGEL